MSREIKFRAWDTKESCWVAGFSINQSGLFSDLINAKIEEPQHLAVADAHWQPVPEHIVIQQSTGFKDKTGALIFEGDIIGSSRKSGRWGQGRQWLIYEVFFDEAQAAFKIYYPIMDWTSFMGLDEPYEVLGNIYESPELLTKKYEG